MHVKEESVSNLGVSLINSEVISDFTHKAVKLLSRLQGKPLRGTS